MTDENTGASVPTESESADIETTEQPTGEAVETKAEETNAEAKEETVSGDDTTEKESKKNSFQERINQKTRQAKEAEQRAIEAEQRAQMWQQRYEGGEQGEFPKLEDFDYDQGKFQEAVNKYATDQNQRTVHQAMGEQERLQTEAARQQANQAVVEAFQARSSAFAEEHPDFMEKISNPSFTQSEAMKQAIVLSESGPQLAYHLAANPAKAAEINALPAGLAMMQLGILSQQLTPSKSVITSKTPAPADPVVPSGQVSKDPEKMSPAEYAKYRGYR